MQTLQEGRIERNEKKFCFRMEKKSATVRVARRLAGEL
jgi:hypothetical protein